jgi:hypothetical protein
MKPVSIMATLIVLWVAFWAALCFGAPPPNADPTLHEWFERQVNMRGGSCCGLGDGHVLTDEDWRAGKAGYEVRIKNEWYPVDEPRMRNTDGGPNPTGHAVAWWTEYPGGEVHVWCFAPGTGS